MSVPTKPAPPREAGAGGREFLFLIATCMSMAAISIDLLLPAFPDMRADFGMVEGSTEVSRVITAFFLGLAVGQLFYGPFSDRFGRRRLLFVGLAVFIAGAVASVLMTSFSGLVVCRFVWGFGAAAARSLAVAMVRDTFEGDAMARTMSFVMTIFVVVPVFAPAVGAGLLVVAPWRAVLWFQIAVAAALAVWALRLPETLHPEDRRAVTPRALLEAAGVVFRSRQTVTFGLAITAMFGIITGYLGTSEVMIDEVFGQGDRFALIFGAIAVTLAFGSLASARLVVRLGLDRLMRVAVLYLLAGAVGLAVVAWLGDGHPPLWAFMVSLALLLPGVTLLIPSCNTAAMAPLGHVAGMGAAILGTVSTAGGSLLGSAADAAYDGTIGPFAAYVLVYAVVAAVAVLVLARPSVDVDAVEVVMEVAAEPAGAGGG